METPAITQINPNGRARDRELDSLGFSFAFAFISILWFITFCCLAVANILFGAETVKGVAQNIAFIVLLMISWTLGAMTFAGHIVVFGARNNSTAIKPLVVDADDIGDPEEE